MIQTLEPREQPNVAQKFPHVILFVLFLNLFFYRALGSFAFSLWILGVFVFLVSIFFENNNTSPQRKTIALSFGTLIALATLILVRSQWVVAIVLGGSSLAITALYVYMAARRVPSVRSLSEFLWAPLSLAITYLRSTMRTIGYLHGAGSVQSTKAPNSWIDRLASYRPLGMGIIIGIPIATILVVLLLRADPIFSYTVTHLFRIKIPDQLVGRLILSGIATAIMLPFIFFQKPEQHARMMHLPKLIAYPQEVRVVLTLVAMVMGAFLLIQWPYVFASVAFETDLSRFGVATYSEYVRRGFIELILIAGILYSLLWAGLVSLRQGVEGHNRILGILQAIVFVQLGVFVTSIFRRIWLYQSYHGWSIVRVYGALFLIWLTGMIVLLALRHYWNRRWVKGETLFTFGMIIVFGLWNAERFIASTHPPTVNHRTDHVYLSRMSSDGIEGWSLAMTYAEEVLDKRHLAQKQFLDRSDRRDISQAGMIVWALVRNYHDLIALYGSPEEKRVYARAILEYQKQAIDDVLARTTLKGQSQPQQIPLARSQIEPFLKTKRWIRDQLDNDELPNRSIDAFSVTYAYAPAPSQQMQILYAAEEPKSFYVVNDLPASVRGKTVLDTLFLWNWSRRHAYQQMHRTIGYEKLLSLQNQFFSLYQKIASQPENERDVTLDISLDTPFLEPL